MQRILERQHSVPCLAQCKMNYIDARCHLDLRGRTGRFQTRLSKVREVSEGVWGAYLDHHATRQIAPQIEEKESSNLGSNDVIVFVHSLERSVFEGST
jgi:hypothetical protein